MRGSSPTHSAAIETLYRQESRRIYATLVRLLGNFALAEDMLQEAFITASKEWPGKGMPNNATAWLVTVARNRGLDRLRREQGETELAEDLIESEETLAYEPGFDTEVLEDDRLRLIFTCCHPALAPEVQIALTL